MGDDAKEEKRDVPKKGIYDSAIDEFVLDHGRKLNDEAIKILRDMEPDDQKRVLSGGPLVIYTDIRACFRQREKIQKKREIEVREHNELRDISKPATKENVTLWIEANKKYMTEAGVDEISKMDPYEQWRVISGGPLGEDMDPVCIIETRAKQGRQLQDDLIKMMKGKREAEEKKTAKTQVKELKPNTPRVASLITDRFVRFVGKEVPADQRRCAGFAGEATWEEKKPLVGECRGVGGVVEVLKTKYGCRRGERLKCVGEKGPPSATWLLEEGKSVPKLQEKEGGFKWVIKEAPAPEKSEAKAQDEAANVKPDPKSFAAALEKETKKIESKKADPDAKKEDGPGSYEMLADGLLREGPSLTSKRIGDVRQGKLVNVLEVTTVKDENRIMARIDEPSGWISLASTDKHQKRYAVQTDKKTGFDEKLISEQESGLSWQFQGKDKERLENGA